MRSDLDFGANDRRHKRTPILSGMTKSLRLQRCHYMGDIHKNMTECAGTRKTLRVPMAIIRGPESAVRDPSLNHHALLRSTNRGVELRKGAHSACGNSKEDYAFLLLSRGGGNFIKSLVMEIRALTRRHSCTSKILIEGGKIIGTCTEREH
jgi:hypothetical protein